MFDLRHHHGIVLRNSLQKRELANWFESSITSYKIFKDWNVLPLNGWISAIRSPKVDGFWT